jgi:hypothetical protein
MSWPRTSPLVFAALGFASCGTTKPPGAGPPAPQEAPRDETGFIDVPPQANGSPHSARMFYVFEAADSDATNKPLAVFMAGGPGYPSSLELLPYGTAHVTLESPLSKAPPAPNPATWTSFANLLFIDERQSGFSYEVGDGSASTSTDAEAGCTFSPLDDAADFVRVLLGFLDVHPSLRSTPVILVGQSYGGERATFVLDLLLRYSTEAPRVDAALLATIQAHYDKVFPEEGGAVIAESRAVTQFGRAVLLQPLVLGGLQYEVQAQLMPSDTYVGKIPKGRDPYDVRQASGYSQAIDDTPALLLSNFADATKLLATDPRSVSGMGPATRRLAFRPSSFRNEADGDADEARMNSAWATQLGALQPADRYLVCPATACPVDESAMATGPGSEDAFLANLQGGVRAFISHARYDGVIYAPAIPAALERVATVTIDTAPRAGAARPGWFTVRFPEDAGVAAAPAIEVRFPPYDSSGHYVAIGQPQALHDDVAAWIAEEP